MLKTLIDLSSLEDQSEKLVADGKKHKMTKGELVKATDDVIRETAIAILLDDAEMECDDIGLDWHGDIVDSLFNNCESDFWTWCAEAGCPIHRSGIEDVVEQVDWDWSSAIKENENLWIDDDEDDQ